MSLIVEDGTGMPDAESYVSVSEADMYHTKMANTVWTESSDVAKKEAMLRRAVRYLDGAYGVRTNGDPKNVDQALIFPQVGATYMDGREVPEDSVPQVWKDAQCEAALLALQGVDLATTISAGPRLKRKKTDVLEKEWFEDSYVNQPFFGWLDVLLAPLVPPTDDDQTIQIGQVVRA